jgi:hypothetical protein
MPYPQRHVATSDHRGDVSFTGGAGNRFALDYRACCLGGRDEMLDLAGRQGALGLGTMVGWKRVVVTVGEKIGKRPTVRPS